ncbi:nitroreductase/quinone reductase family protein [Streptomyces sp. NPDC056161]|uniref:nitroreductase/quinone reductase family protein n=1 Tax=Streptomyces sp. NPDC056161 TaxID=3345732 RepID=UPI0035D62CB5
MPERHTSTAAFNQQVIDEFRANGGRVGGMFAGTPLLLLTTTGARTGRPRTTPVVHARGGAHLLVFGSNGGGPRHPAWYRNLLADHRVTVEVGTGDGAVDRYAAVADVLHGAERDRRFRDQCRRDPAFAAYATATSRLIPVIALTRASEAAVPGSVSAERARALGEFLVRVHGELRRHIAALLDEIDAHRTAPTDPPAPALGGQLATHCLTVCAALHEHHTNEDGVFSGFERQWPELAPVIARLRAEHRSVATGLTGVEAIADRLAGAPSGADTERLRAELTRLTDELEAHFRHEEEQLLPVLFGKG